MMVNFPICLKVTLVNSGCNNRFICYFDGSDRFSGLAKWFLDSDVIFGAVGLGSEQKDISPQIYDCMFYTIFFQIIFDTIRNISFGNSTYINGSVWIQKLDGVIRYTDIFVIYVTERRGNCVCIWNSSGTRSKIP